MKTNIKTICYHLNDLNTEKLAFKNCPSCHADLETREIESSEAAGEFNAMIPVITTTLGQCPHCGWWAIRELWEDFEVYYPPRGEYIVMDASTKSCVVPEQEGCAPWEQALDDKACWANAIPMPFSKASQIFGGGSVAQAKLRYLDMKIESSGVAQFVFITAFILLVLFVVFIVL